MAPKEPVPPAIRRHVRVVVADDSAFVRQRLIAVLANVTGIKVVGEATNALEAIDQIELLRPDVAILEVRMPPGSGMETLAHVKMRVPGVTVIMFSMTANDELRRVATPSEQTTSMRSRLNYQL